MTGSMLDKQRTQKRVFSSGEAWFTLSTTAKIRDTGALKIPTQFLFVTKAGFWFALTSSNILKPVFSEEANTVTIIIKYKPPWYK
jgi:hypothetical protein